MFFILFLSLLYSTDSAFTFTTKLALQTAVDSWCAGDQVQALFDYGTVDEWNVSQITDMDQLFSGKSTCNPDIGNWDMSKVTTMSSMFFNAVAFNRPIGNWNTARVKYMNELFGKAYAFNQPIGNWNTATVTTMSYMFYNAAAFNQPINNWNTRNVVSMAYMFQNAAAFNQTLCLNTLSADLNDMISGSPLASLLPYPTCTNTPTAMPTAMPTAQPTAQPTTQPTEPPTAQPTAQPTTAQPTEQPTEQPTTQPTEQPTTQPTTTQPTAQPTAQPTTQPTEQPTAQPTTTQPTAQPTTTRPTAQPTLKKFENRAELKTAVDSWCGNVASARASVQANYGVIGDWDVSRVTDMTELFYGKTTFNQQIGNWDTSRVIATQYMFRDASAFNQPIGNWNTGKFTELLFMFVNANAFNQPIGTWDVGNVTTMASAFYNAHAFNQPIDAWNTAKLTNTNAAFMSAAAFNQPIGSWNTANVLYTSNMFMNAQTFNQPIGNWNTGKVLDMGTMFSGAAAFNQPMNNWDTSQVTNMAGMFRAATKFNQPLSFWNTTQVTVMGAMFEGASVFNGNIRNWDTSKVQNMYGMFASAGAFNQGLCWKQSTGLEKTNIFYSSQGSFLTHPDCIPLVSGCDGGYMGTFNGSTYEAITTYSTTNNKPCRICTDKYDYVVTDQLMQNGLVKAVLYASNVVNCSAGSRAFATNVVTKQVYSTPLKNQGNMTCVADWYGVFATQNMLSNSFMVTFAFTNLGNNVTLARSYNSMNVITTIQSLTEPQLVISSITSQAVGVGVEYETTVQLSLGAETQSCTFPSTINLVLGNGTAANCRPTAISMTTETPGQYKWRHIYVPLDITGCNADNAADDEQYFQLPMSVEIPYSSWAGGNSAWCFGEETVTGQRGSQCYGSTAQVRPTIARGQTSNIRINKRFVSNSNGAVNRVALSMVSYGATPCTGEIFSAQGTPYMTIKATGLSENDVSSLAWSATDQVKNNATILRSNDCGDVDSKTTCVVFSQVGCQAMNNFQDRTCSFANNDKVLIVTATNIAGSTTNMLTAPLNNNTFTTCSIPKTTQNVTALYSINFTATREDGAPGISLYRPIVSKLVLTNLNSSGPLSFYITDVTVELRQASSTLVSHTFTRSEKQKLMSLTSPYSADAHYCRTMSSSDKCSSFYSLFSTPFTAASNSTYNVNGGYKSCQDMTVMNEDRFIFTPSDWGMDRYIGLNLDMRFIFTAMMTRCSGSAGGGGGRRMLDVVVPSVAYINVTKNLSRDICQKTKSNNCAKIKSCKWATNPTQFNSRATCVAKSTISHWACENILSAGSCLTNKACTLNKNKKVCMTKTKK
jgi:surface protein